MPTFIGLMTLTDQGRANVKGMQERRAGRSVYADLGVEIKAWYMTTGRYDGIAIVEAPTTEAVVAAFMTVAGDGNSRAEIVQAFPLDEFFETILSKVQ